MIAVKRTDTSGPCALHYFGVADYQTQEQKLAAIDDATLANVPWQTLTPNAAGDWLNQRNDVFASFPAIGSKDATDQLVVFALHSSGLKTNRDAWCYNSSHAAVEHNMARMIDFYNDQATASAGGNERDLDRDPRSISWSGGLSADALRGRQHTFKPERIYRATYRPFTHQWAYFDRTMNERVYRLDAIFPTPNHQNMGITVIEAGARAPFSVLMAGDLPDSKVYVDAAQFFPRWTYEATNPGSHQGSLMEPEDDLTDAWGYRRVDNVTDAVLAVYRAKFGTQVSKDEIFYYVYGVLHSEQYRTVFAADLKRMLPRIPLAASKAGFESFAEAGRRLADLHIGYETVEPYPLHEQAPLGMDPWDAFRVTKMRWADKATKKTLIYNAHVTLGDVPAEAHRYMLGSRSALDWLVDRYQVKTDKASGIVNDPNDWGREHDDPRYIVDLVKRVTRVSIDTMAIVDSLPELPI